MSSCSTLTQFWFYVVPPSATLAQHKISIGSTSSVYWGSDHSVNTRRSPSFGWLLAHRLRRWPSSKPTLDQLLMFSGQMTARDLLIRGPSRYHSLGEVVRSGVLHWPPRNGGGGLLYLGQSQEEEASSLQSWFDRGKKWNESGFRPPLCTYRLNWARRTSWGWWDDWNDTVLQTQDSKFEPGGLRPSTLPLGHGGSPQYWLSHVDGEETFLFLSNRRDREPNPELWRERQRC